MISNFAIGPNHSSLAVLTVRGLPNPHPVTYKPFNQTYFDGTGRPKGDGFASVSWSFDVLTQVQLQYFIGLLNPDFGDAVNIVTRTDYGADYDAQFAEFAGFVERPVFGRDYEVSMGRQLYQNVKFNFVNLIEV